MYKRLRPLCCEERLTLQICIRVKTFSKSRTTSGEGKWDTGGRGWLPRLSGPPGSEGSSLQSRDACIRRCHRPWTQESCNVTWSPMHVRPLPLENGQDAPRLPSVLRPWKLGPQPRAVCRAEAGWKQDCSAGRSPKGPG